MKKLRKRDPALFDLVLFIGFTVGAFLCYVLTNAAGTAGALLGLSLLASIAFLLVFSH